MMKALALLRTNLLLFLATLIGHFNLLLANPASFHSQFKGPDPDTLVHQNQHFYSNPDTLLLAEKQGKVIKETRTEKKELKINTVVIDPGHGGHDPGCLGGQSKEKHIALAVAKKLASAMKKKYPGVRVILTRDKDVFIPLYERAAIANRNKADLFISIHCNYITGSKATRGSETYVMGLHTADHNLDVAKRENASILLEENYEKNYDFDPNSPEGHITLSMYQNAYLEQSILFANMVEDKFFRKAQRKSRGVKQAGFVVLKETTMPSVLVETGFLSNRYEERFLLTSEGQNIMADAMLDAFVDYKEVIETGSFNPIAFNEPKAPQEVTAPAVDDRHQSQRIGGSFYSNAANSKSVTTKQGYTNANTHPTPTPVQPQQPPATRNLPTERPLPAIDEAKDVVFMVQLAASPSPLNTNTDKWQNLDYLIEVKLEDRLYKYQARNFSSHHEANSAKIVIQNNGFPDAFLVAYKDGKRIPIYKAKQELGLK